MDYAPPAYMPHENVTQGAHYEVIRNLLSDWLDDLLNDLMTGRSIHLRPLRPWMLPKVPDCWRNRLCMRLHKLQATRWEFSAPP